MENQLALIWGISLIGSFSLVSLISWMCWRCGASGCVRQQWPWLVPAQWAAAPSFVGTFDFYGATNEATLLLFANKTSFINADARSPNEGEDEWELIFSFAACSSLLSAAVWLFPATVKVSLLMSNKDKDPYVISASSGWRCLFPTVLRGRLKWTPKKSWLCKNAHDAKNSVLFGSEWLWNLTLTLIWQLDSLISSGSKLDPTTNPIAFYSLLWVSLFSSFLSVFHFNPVVYWDASVPAASRTSSSCPFPSW